MALAAWERQRTADPRKYGLNRYGDFFQTDMLVAIGGHHGLPPTNVTPVTGPSEAASVLAAELLRPGAELVRSTPVADPISRPATAWGGSVRTVPLAADSSLDLAAIAAAVGPRTRLVHVQNPHDPTGRSFGQADFQRLLDAVAERNPDAYVWVDETYAPFSTRRDFPDPFAEIAADVEGSHVVVSRSLATAHGLGGVPAGYLVASRALTMRTEGVTNGFFVPEQYGWANPEAGVSRMAEQALLALLTPAGERHLAQVRRMNRERRERLAEMLAGRGFDVVPSDASFVFARAPGRFRDGGLNGALKGRGVIVRTSRAWGRGYRGHVRVNVGLPRELDRLERALDAVLGRGRPRARRGSPAVADRRAVVAGAGTAGVAWLAQRAAARMRELPDETELRRALTRRGFLLRAGAAAAGSAWLLSRPEAARGFPPDSFYDTFDLARMIYHENPVGPSPAALEAIREVLARGPLAAREAQPDDPPDLVDAILAYNRPRSPAAARMTPRNVMCTVGSAEGLFLAADTFVAGGTIVSEWPSYRIIRERVLQAGGTVVDVPLTREFTPDYEALKRALRDHPDTGLVHFNVQNNPMGTVLRRADFDAFVEHVHANHPAAVIVADESDREFMQPGREADVPDFFAHVERDRNLVHLQTFSHVFGLTGLRAGYLFASPRLIDRMRPKRIRAPLSVFARAAALAALHDADAQIERCRTVVDDGRDYIYGELDRLGLRYARSQGQYVMLDTGRSGTAVWTSLIAQGVLTRYGLEWDMESWIRVCPGLPDENERFIASLRTALSQPDPGNLPQLPIPGGPANRRLAGGLERRLARDRMLAERLGPVRRPYRVARAG